MLEDMKTQGDRGGAPAAPTAGLRHTHTKHAPSTADLSAHTCAQHVSGLLLSQTFLRKKHVINILSLETVSKMLNPVYFVRCLCSKGGVSILLSSHV